MSHEDSLTEGREICPKCKIPQDVKLTPIDDITYEQEFSCGFKHKLKVMPPIIEEVRVRDKVEANVIKFRTRRKVLFLFLMLLELQLLQVVFKEVWSTEI